MDAAWSISPDKHLAMQAGVEIKTSGGPASAARCKPKIRETFYINQSMHILK